MTTFDKIPVLDLSNDGSKGQGQIHQDVLEAYGNVGFAYVVGHGIPQEMVDGVFEASRKFHALDIAEKRKITLDSNHRGFIAINTSTDVNSKLAEVKKPNQSESFMMMREDAPGSPAVARGDYLAGGNQWPELAGFREAVEAYNSAMATLAGRMMRIFAEALDADPDAVMDGFSPATTWLRLLYYPPVEPDPDGDLYGSAPHTDFGCLTILAQDEVGGLQVQTPEGAWIDAPYVKGAFVVNVGDMLHRMSNGRLLSTPHRVINRSGRSRFSCPFFFDPNVRTDVHVLPSCVDDNRPAGFDDINFGDFLRAELEAGYQAHKKTP